VKPRLLIALLALALGPACLVLTVHPAYDDDTLTWEPGLVGNWQNTDDKSFMVIERDEWTSYKIHYVHPIEKGDLTGYLTILGDSRYLDVMPVRGQDRGAFLIPVHAVVSHARREPPGADAVVVRLVLRSPEVTRPDTRPGGHPGSEAECAGRLEHSSPAGLDPPSAGRRPDVRSAGGIRPKALTVAMGGWLPHTCRICP